MSFVRTSGGSTAAKVPAGCIVSSHDGSQLVSTGVSDLDFVLGGGIPIGRVLCVKEDR